MRESIQKHIAKRSLIRRVLAAQAAVGRARRVGRSPRDKPSGEMRLPDAVADEWARIDRKLPLRSVPTKNCRRPREAA